MDRVDRLEGGVRVIDFKTGSVFEAGLPDPANRLPGTLAATAAAVLGGAHVIRAHDVAETAQAVRIAQAIRRAAPEHP